MSLYQRILVALDGSEESLNALRYAIELSKKLGSEIKALTVVQLKGEVSSALSLFLGMEDLFKRGAESILKRGESIASELGVEITTLMRRGDPATEIVDAALSEGCDLIVAGKTGKTGLTKVLLGSTAYRLLAGSPMDTLLVPKWAKFNLENLLVATDASGPAQRAGFKALNLAQAFKSKLYLLSVIEIDPLAFEGEGPNLLDLLERHRESQTKSFTEVHTSLTKRCEAEHLPCYSQIAEGVAHEAILRTAQSKEIGLIIMGSYGRSGLKKFLLGSVTEKVVSLSEIPVLVVKS